VDVHPDIYEIPTVQSDIERLAETVQKLPIADLFQDAAKAAKGIERFVNAPELEEAVQALSGTATDIQTLVRNTDATRARLASQFETTLRTLDRTLVDVQGQVPVAGATLEQVRATFAMKGGVPGALASDLRSTLETARDALGQAEETLATVEELAEAESPLNDDLTNTLREVAAAARSIRILADFIQRHPEAFLAGKGGPGG
jgi:paraquat-inducible protein B